MKKLDKYIQKSNFVKVYIGDEEGNAIKHFEGFVFSYTDHFVFMSDLSDFNYDGFVVLRKKDIIDVRCTESEKYFENILRQENILRNIRLQKREYPFRLNTMEKMFKSLMEMKIPVIIEKLYDEDEEFLIGPVKKVSDDSVYLKYFNTVGEFDKDLVKVNFDTITSFSFDSPYANLFFKYADEGKSIKVELEEEVEIEENMENEEEVKVEKKLKKDTKKSKKEKPEEALTEPKKKKKKKKKEDSEGKKKKKKKEKSEKKSKKGKKEESKKEKSKDKKKSKKGKSEKKSQKSKKKK